MIVHTHTDTHTQGAWISILNKFISGTLYTKETKHSISPFFLLSVRVARWLDSMTAKSGCPTQQSAGETQPANLSVFRTPRKYKYPFALEVPSMD
jgi:hypothetical protein